MKRLGIILVLLGWACAAPPEWEKPDATQEQYEADSSACYDATPKNGWLGHVVGASPTLTSAIEEAYAHCMTGKGYVKVQSPQR